jgi:hypothetical protein
MAACIQCPPSRSTSMRFVSSSRRVLDPFFRSVVRGSHTQHPQRTPVLRPSYNSYARYAARHARDKEKQHGNGCGNGGGCNYPRPGVHGDRLADLPCRSHAFTSSAMIRARSKYMVVTPVLVSCAASRSHHQTAMRRWRIDVVRRAVAVVLMRCSLELWELMTLYEAGCEKIQL